MIAPPSHEGPCKGQTVWGGLRGEEIDAGVAWDWVQLMPHVVAMADPLAVVTNLRFLGAEGEVLGHCECAVHLTEIVHGLPWQREVVRALNALH